MSGVGVAKRGRKSIVARLALWRPSPLLHVVLVAASLFAVFVAGALFLPLGTGPDEPGHYVHAAAVVRGQVADLTPVLPAGIDNLHRFAGCLAFNPGQTAICQNDVRVPDPQALVESDTAAGYYNPVFYAWTGLGSLVTQDESGLYIARILSAVVTSAIFGWAVSFLLRTATSRWAATVVFVLTTPLVLYIGSVLNPSAWEITGSFAAVLAAWAILVRPARGTSGWREAHWLLVIAGSLMIVSRGMSPVFFVLLIFAVCLAAGWRRVLAAMRTRSVLLAALALGVVGVLSLLWPAIFGTNYVGIDRPATLWDGIRSIPVFYQDAFGQVGMMYGNLGWLDVPPHDVLVLAWLGAGVAYTFVSFAVSDTRARWAIGTAAIVCLLLPGVVAGIQWSGADWQGRYTLPLVVVLLTVSALGADPVFLRGYTSSQGVTSRLEGVASVASVSLFGVGAIAMAVLVARRYMVGVAAPLRAEPIWVPPVSWELLGAIAVIGLACFTALVLQSVAQVRRVESAASEQRR